MTQELYQKAIKFAGEKHKDQKVPGTNSNYLLHISNVAMEIILAHNAANNFDLNYAVQLALLHDTLEDTDTDFSELLNKFGEKVAIGVQALTKNKNLDSKKEKMIDSLNRINKLKKEVGMVKLADRITNLQEPPKHWKKDKIQHYLSEAIVINETLNNKNEYLNKRLENKIAEYKKYTTK
ncbi:HD domain-containing protein [Tenacibaculum sp. ZH5_bin.1]|uniref:HD domain-containing protein n=1 Tax=Tenacibaculum TaxID=104267 RepID=UPI001430C160|nr:HD domain-containing protein [Tenacibaculum mesophilum]KAF9658219.1 bifunctional (p)ppGpp synthetase/guanosine-3',5'-bis(diphosphate) 3'-pyrophosphohydrolase [Tenacibaculum mesophilum]